MTVRLATVLDIPVIEKIARATWPATYGAILSRDQMVFMLSTMYSATTLQEQMENGHRFLLAYAGEIVAGFAGFSPSAQPGIYQLHKLYVSPIVQGGGVGRMLIAEVMELTRKTGATKLRLNVNRFNKARLFYEKHGFEVTGEEDIAIGNGYFMNDYVMERSLIH